MQAYEKLLGSLLRRLSWKNPVGILEQGKKVPEDGKKERTITKEHTTQKIPHAGEIPRVLFCALR